MKAAPRHSEAQFTSGDGRAQLRSLLEKATPAEAEALQTLLTDAVVHKRQRDRRNADNLLLVATLNQCGQPVILVGPDGRIRLVNRAGAAELASRAGLLEESGMLHAIGHFAQSRLGEALATARRLNETAHITLESSEGELSYDIVPLTVPQLPERFVLVIRSGTRNTEMTRWR